MQDKWIELLKELKTTKSNKDKEAILIKYKDSKLVQQMLVYCLSPYELFFIKKMPKLQPVPNVHGRPAYMFVIDLLEDLKARKITGNAAIEKVTNTFNLLTQEEVEAYGKVLLKEAIGVGEATVKKVWPDLIPSFDVMLAPSELANVGALKFPQIVQPKLDGFRTLWVPHISTESLWARSGLVLPNTKLMEYFSSLLSVQDYVLDGELYNHGISFNKLQSIINSEDQIIPPNTVFTIYDAIPIQEWVARKGKTTYDKRLKTVRELVQSRISDRKKIQDIDSTTCNTAKEVIELYKSYLKNDYEGAMIKNPLGYYKWKRVTPLSGEMLKMKPFQTLDLKCVGVYEGEGKYQGMLGGLDVDFNGVTVSVSSGLTDVERKELWRLDNRPLGKIIEVKYFEITEDGSLRFPTFVRIREDKK